MLGDSITITLGGSGGTDKVLNKINSGKDYSAEYLLREATQEFSALISHSKNGTRDRHYMEVKQTIFATDPDEADIVRTVSAVILAKPSDTSADVTDLQEGLSFFLDGTNTPKLLNWES
jgi:hypothetical protein